MIGTDGMKVNSIECAPACLTGGVRALLLTGAFRRGTAGLPTVDRSGHPA